MPVGPGKYDQYCKQLIQELEAHTVIVVVVGGKYGNGFSVNTVDPDAHSKLPGVLRHMADQIEESVS